MQVPTIYESGSLVYEPFLGLCQILRSSQETMLGTQQLFYELLPRQAIATIKVPAGQMVSRGIRSLMSVQEIEDALNLEQPPAAAVVDTESGFERLRRWTQLLRAEPGSGPYYFLREWQQLTSQGARFLSQECELRTKIQRSLAQEIAQVFAITNGRAVLKLNHWLDPQKATKKVKKR